MVIANQLERIAKLVEALAPLGDKQRGMKIEAEDWNRLVTTMRGILEVDKAQEDTARLVLEENFAEKTHEHLGAVEVTWLDPTLQERISEGGGSLSVRIALADVSKRVDTFSAEVARLTAVAEEQQKRNDRSAVDELERSAKLREFEQRFSGLEDLRGLVTALDGRVGDLAPAIQDILDLRQELRDDQGNPIDVGHVVRDVAALEALAANLNGVDGSPVRLRDVEIQIRELQDVLDVGGGGGLEGRLAALAADLEARLDARVDDRVSTVRADLATENEAARTQLAAELDAKVSASQVAIEQSSDAKIAAAETRIGASVQDGLRSTGDTLRAELTDLVTARIDQRVDELLQKVDERVRALIDERLTDVAGQVAALVDERLKELDLPGQFKDLAARLREELGGQLAELRKELETELRETRARLTEQIRRLDERVTALEH